MNIAPRIVIGLLLLLVVYSVSCEEQERVFPEYSSKTATPSGWSHLYKVNDVVNNKLNNRELFISVTIALKHRNRELLRKTVENVSNPDSPYYGQHLTFEQVNQMVAPDSEQVDSVVSWLSSAHPDVRITHITPGQGFIIARIPVLAAQELFQCEFSLFKNQETGATLIRTQGPYSIPKKLSRAIAFVGDLIRFPKHIRRQSPLAVNDVRSITPGVIRDYYNISNHPVKPIGRNSQAVASFLEQYYSESDLKLFWDKYKIQHVDVEVVGDNEENDPGIEASLDIQYLTAVGEGIPTWFVSTPGTHEGQETFLRWIINMTSFGEKTPYVHSVSYGDVEQTVSIAYAERLDEEFQKFGATGRTILIASGDNGARCNFDGTFVPEWPTSSPWVTSVGATRPFGDDKDEISTTWSGGGFSNYYKAPKYQIEAIEQYWRQPDTPSKSFYNSTGRAYPDVSAFGVNYDVAYRGEYESVDGTSASTPTFAGIVSLLNNARLSVNKKPLGFLNYAIYQRWSKVPNAFKDITVGGNAQPPCIGFICTPGWDPVTGFGTPNVGILLNLAKLL